MSNYLPGELQCVCLCVVPISNKVPMIAQKKGGGTKYRIIGDDSKEEHWAEISTERKRLTVEY
jgi:hypothetical protein